MGGGRRRREEGGGATWGALKCSIRTRLPVWSCFTTPLERRENRFFLPTRVDADQTFEPFKSPSRPSSGPRIHLCAALLPEPLRDWSTERAGLVWTARPLSDLSVCSSGSRKEGKLAEVGKLIKKNKAYLQFSSLFHIMETLCRIE